PLHAGNVLLSSGRLTDGANADNTLEFSGDLLCVNENNVTYAPKMFPLLTHVDEVARNEIFPTGLHSASDLFDACLRELRTPVGTLGKNDGSVNGISNAIIAMFAEAKCV